MLFVSRWDHCNRWDIPINCLIEWALWFDLLPLFVILNVLLLLHLECLLWWYLLMWMMSSLEWRMIGVTRSLSSFQDWIDFCVVWSWEPVSVEYVLIGPRLWCSLCSLCPNTHWFFLFECACARFYTLSVLVWVNESTFTVASPYGARSCVNVSVWSLGSLYCTVCTFCPLTLLSS